MRVSVGGLWGWMGESRVFSVCLGVGVFSFEFGIFVVVVKFVFKDLFLYIYWVFDVFIFGVF